MVGDDIWDFGSGSFKVLCEVYWGNEFEMANFYTD